MQCKVKWVGPDDMSFIAETESGHAFVMDGAPEGGGRNLGPGRWRRCSPEPVAAPPTTWC